MSVSTSLLLYIYFFLTALEDSLFYSPRPSYLAVVAIDFGTTYSGFAFSFIKDQGKDAIFMNMDWVNEQGSQTSKTPTCLLLKPDLSFDSFGYDAIEKYAALQGESEEKEYLFFKHFKMALHSEEVSCLSFLISPHLPFNSKLCSVLWVGLLLVKKFNAVYLFNYLLRLSD